MTDRSAPPAHLLALVAFFALAFGVGLLVAEVAAPDDTLGKAVPGEAWWDETRAPEPSHP